MSFKGVSPPLGKVFSIWSLLLYFGSYLLTLGINCIWMSFVAAGAKAIREALHTEKSTFSTGVMFSCLL